MAATKSLIAALVALSFLVSTALPTADVPFIVVHKKAALNRLKSGPSTSPFLLTPTTKDPQSFSFGSTFNSLYPFLILDLFLFNNPPIF
ncbi:hypothetical protein SLE2022_349890 [Rubroshorea leprosula]